MFPIVEIRSNDDLAKMKSVMLLCLIPSLLLGACATQQRRETEVVIPSHDQVVRDEAPTDSGRKVPIVRTY